jgi:tetratricopeptide (TPR) repeat protein
MTAYSSFLGFMINVRFGSDSAISATARQLLDQTALADPSMLTQLAQCAADVAGGQLQKGQTTLAELAQATPDSIDVAILQGEVALRMAKPEAATVAFERAIKIERSARTVFGLARAQDAHGKTKAAAENASVVLKLSKNHVGARLMLAREASKKDATLDQAIKLIEEVTKPGPAHSAASLREQVEALSLLGETLLKRSQASAAEKAFAEALSLSPQAHSALIGTGELFFRAGRFSEALARFQAARNLDNKNIPANVGLAKTLIALERPREAKSLLLRRASVGTSGPLLRYWIGRTEAALGDREAAEKSYRQSIADAAGSQDVILPYVALAKLIAADGHQKEAHKLLMEASKKLPKSAALHHAKGDVALHAGRLDDADVEYRQALALDPKNLASRFNLGVVQRRKRNFKKAEQIFDAVAKIDGEYPGLALERGLLFEETGEMSRALQAYADALAKAPKDIDLKLRVGSAQVIGGHARQAVPLLREVLKDRPQSAEVNHFLGRALLLMGGAANESLPYLKEAVRHDPNRAQYHLYIGWAANQAGQPVLAEKSLKRALELDQNLADAYWQRGVLLQKRGQTIDALEDVTIALEKRPSRYQAYATMALCHQDQADYVAAEKSWRRALAGNNTIAEWHFRLGKILFDRRVGMGGKNHIAESVALIEKDKDHAAPAWAWNAYLLLAESHRNSDKDKSIAAYHRFLKLSALDNAYRYEAKVAIKAMGGRVR